MAANTNGSGANRSLTRRAARAGGLKLARRLIKPIPIVGTAVALGFAGYEIKKKGWRNGLIHVGLDITPVVGTVKDVIEIFTGDLIPDKKNSKP
ncbi:MAG TPA: hypothetical protein VGW12_11235 [Pyrinomonadaceae bacterium]|nr:hypothetical protein [Pyrinomonadaceae bacterium]